MRASGKLIVKAFFCTFIICAGIVYGLFQSRELIAGPIVDVTSPENGATVTSPLVEITGFAKNIAFITLNGEQIYTNENGEFKEKLLAAPGVNTLVVSVTDKFNRAREEKIELFYKAPEQNPENPVVLEDNSEATYQ